MTEKGSARRWYTHRIDCADPFVIGREVYRHWYQLLASGKKHLLDRNRTYFRLLRKICDQGIADKTLKTSLSSGEIIKAYTLWERALLYDWCLCEGDYSLKVYSDMVTPRFMHSLLDE